MFNVIFYNKENIEINSSKSKVSSVSNGAYMFFSSSITSFDENLSNLTNGNYMFHKCSKLEGVNSDLISLVEGKQMFDGCTSLGEWSVSMPSLKYAYYMFNGCSNLKTFQSDLRSLTNGNYMFQNCSNLTSFNGGLSSLTSGASMFNGCSKLTSFSSDLPSLMNGTNMFNQCTNLTSFTSSLNYLITGSGSFNKCKLNSKSIMYIVETIKNIKDEKQLYIDGTIPYVTLSSGVKGFMSDGSYVCIYNNPKPYTTYIPTSYVGKLTLGINVTNNSSTIKQHLDDFAKEATFDSWAELKQAFVDKGWTVTWQYGGTNTSISYDLRGGRVIPCPIYTQLVEVEDKDNAEYTNEDGTKFYNIEWGHEVQNPQDYVQFDSLEDAAISYGVILKG